MQYVDSKKTKKKHKIKKFNGTKFIISALILTIILPLIYLEQNLDNKNKNHNYKLRENIYNSMQIKENRVKAYNNAIYLNNGDSSNTCVYFLAEVLRMNEEKIPKDVCNTTELLGIMNKEGWKVEKDYKKLKPGDICFTTDENLNKNGTPTHVYIFMSWVEEGKYDYAYICDNQAKDYKGKIYHTRNIKNISNIKNSQKEPFSFFMHKN